MKSAESFGGGAAPASAPEGFTSAEDIPF